MTIAATNGIGGAGPATGSAGATAADATAADVTAADVTADGDTGPAPGFAEAAAHRGDAPDVGATAESGPAPGFAEATARGGDAPDVGAAAGSGPAVDAAFRRAEAPDPEVTGIGASGAGAGAGSPPGGEPVAGGAAVERGHAGAGSADAVGERAGTSERAREGVEHLQAAARELIQAARALLDVAEDLVEDPETVTQFVGAVGTIGSLVRDATGIGGRVPGASAPSAGRPHGPGEGGRDRRPGRPAGVGRSDSGLQRIPVL